MPAPPGVPETWRTSVVLAGTPVPPSVEPRTILPVTAVTTRLVVPVDVPVPVAGAGAANGSTVWVDTVAP